MPKLKSKPPVPKSKTKSPPALSYPQSCFLKEFKKLGAVSLLQEWCGGIRFVLPDGEKRFCCHTGPTLKALVRLGYLAKETHRVPSEFIRFDYTYTLTPLAMGNVSAD